jgi:hypothetical protein
VAERGIGGGECFCSALIVRRGFEESHVSLNFDVDRLSVQQTTAVRVWLLRGPELDHD